MFTKEALPHVELLLEDAEPVYEAFPHVEGRRVTPRALSSPNGRHVLRRAIQLLGLFLLFGCIVSVLRLMATAAGESYGPEHVEGHAKAQLDEATRLTAASTDSAALASATAIELSKTLAEARALLSELRGKSDKAAGDKHLLTAVPHKFGVSLSTPRKLQLLRGSCWLFTIGAVLEHSYRKQGVDLGYLKPKQYLRLSEQAIGAVMLMGCRKYNDSRVCYTGDDDAAYTGYSTQGGEVEWVYYMQHFLGTRLALPWSVCPYVETATKDAVCDGYDEANKESPLSFKVESMSTLYELNDIKAAVLTTGRAMSVSLALFGQNFLLPCSAVTAEQLDCDPNGSHCRPCPLAPSFAGIKCCIEQSRFGTNMRGEFSPHRPAELLQPAGGHAVTLVGYTDTYQSSMGYVGGLIVKNSWWDGVPLPGMRCDDPTAPCAAGRGSHSLAWFLQELSDAAEREICPNVHSPYSWYMCSDLAACQAEETRISAAAVRKVLHLECLGDGTRSPYVKHVCDKGERFFLKSVSDFGAGLSVACFVREHGGKDLCLPPLWLEDLALLFTPVPEEDKPNDPDICGYYIVPYEVFRSVQVRFGGTHVSDLDIKWAPSSYANAPKDVQDAEKSYKMLEADTLEQHEVHFSGPFPSVQDIL